MDESATNPETGEVSRPHFDRNGEPIRQGDVIRNEKTVTYGIQIAGAEPEVWVDTYWRDYASADDAADFADSIFTGRRAWRVVKRTVTTVVEIDYLPGG